MPIEEWDRLQPRSPLCNGCQKAFADKEDYHTILSLAQEGYARQDVCEECWTKAGNPAKRAGALSYWQGTYQMPAPPKPEALKKEDAESLLRKFIDSKDPGHSNVRYILAVMLERKRTLKQRDIVEREGEKVLVYEHMRTGETFLIPDPRLRLDQLGAVQVEVVALLAPPPVPTPQEQAAAEAEAPMADAKPE